jgi:hypothetical protein
MTSTNQATISILNNGGKIMTAEELQQKIVEDLSNNYFRTYEFTAASILSVMREAVEGIENPYKKILCKMFLLTWLLRNVETQS